MFHLGIPKEIENLSIETNKTPEHHIEWEIYTVINVAKKTDI